jgi:hypothetical protein
MGCLLWPFAAVIGIFGGALGLAGKIIGFILGAIGGLFSLIIAFILGAVGVALCMTIIGAIIGVPLILFAVSLAFRAIF